MAHRSNGLYQGFDPILLNRLESMVGNLATSRAQLSRGIQNLDPRRDIDDECGYPKTELITAQDYRTLYDREPPATRVVQVLPFESWKSTPSLYEDEDEGTVTEFEEAWANLGQNLRGTSWYKGEQGNPLWEHLRRSDELSGIGQFGLLLLGLDDGAELTEPAKGLDETGKATKARPSSNLLFLRSFDESLIEVVSYETDRKNPRYGQPTFYNLSLNDPTTNKSGIGLPMTVVKVHWSRVLHLADNLASSEVFGIPRMRPVLNRLLDLRKLYGGSAEMYWRGAFPGLSMETHPQLGGDVEIDEETLRDTLENYNNGLQRYLLMSGMTAKQLSPTVVDPTPQIKTQLEAICIRLSIPMRIFLGSERGELASSEDKGTWNERITDRQNNYLTPRVIAPFVDRCIALGVLPEPEEYTVQWPDMDALSEQDKASLALTRTDAMSKYVAGGVDALIVPLDYLTRVLGYSQDEAKQILESTEELAQEKEEEQVAQQEEQLKQQEEQQKELAKAQGQQPTQPEQPPVPGQPPKPNQPGKPVVPSKSVIPE